MSKKFCPQCGTALVEGKKFCGECGFSLEKIDFGDEKLSETEPVKNSTEERSDEPDEITNNDEEKNTTYTIVGNTVGNVVDFAGVDLSASAYKGGGLQVDMSDKKVKIAYVASVVVTVIASIVVMATFRAWLGGILYVIAAIVADLVLRMGLTDETGKKQPNFVIAWVVYKKFSFPKYIIDAYKKKNILDIICATVIFALPVVIFVVIILWINLDSARDAKAMVNRIYKNVR